MCVCGGAKSNLHADSPSAVCSIEGWRIDREFERSCQCWMRKLLCQTWVSPSKCWGDARWGLLRRRSARLEACFAHLVTNNRWALLVPGQSSGTGICCRGGSGILLTLVFLYLSAKNRGKGNIIEDGAFFPPTFFIILFCLNHFNVPKVDLEEG